MTFRARATIAFLLLLPSLLSAQRLPSDDRKPALTRKENWGLSIGVELISASFQPTQCPTLEVEVFVSCEGVEYAYKTRGIGVSMNAGVMFLRHFMLGGEVGTVGFSGNRKFERENPPSSYDASTTNSIMGSGYIGVITSPMGKSPRLGRKWWAGLHAGRTSWSGERAIKSCSQCAVDPLPMGSAYYLQPFVMLGGGDADGGGGLRLSYRHQFGGNEAMHSAMTLGLFFAFGRL
jgi:hypothetical protein